MAVRSASSRTAVPLSAVLDKSQSKYRDTFRPTAQNTAWQKQLRDRFNAEGTPPVPHLDLARALVRPIRSELAKQIILKYEWLGTMSNTGQHFGIFFGPFCAGVTCVSLGSGTANGNNHVQFGLTSHLQLAVLARGACVHWAPPGTNSKLVAWTCKLLAKHTTAKVIIAYADSDAGEIGTIYQACNWVYIGQGSSTTQFKNRAGRIYDQKVVANTKAKNVQWSVHRDYLLANGWTMQQTNPKGRYVYVLDRKDKSLVQRIERLRLPYPKRPESAESIQSATDTPTAPNHALEA